MSRSSSFAPLRWSYLTSSFAYCGFLIIQFRLLVQQIKHEIITISETWLNSTVSNADIELEGYKILRLDRLGKVGGGVCMYYRNDIKVSYLKELSSISSFGFHQLWVKIQHRKLRSIIVCVVYRPPDCPVTCLMDDLAPNHFQALTHGKDIFMLGDLNCNMLKDIPESRALKELCTCLNLSQLITLPTRVTERSSSLIDF